MNAHTHHISKALRGISPGPRKNVLFTIKLSYFHNFKEESRVPLMAVSNMNDKL